MVWYREFARQGRKYTLAACLGAGLFSPLSLSAAPTDSTQQAVSTPSPTLTEAVPLEACVQARRVRNIDVVDEQLLVLRGTADRFWLSRLPNRCDGLKDRMVLSIDRYGSKICANDRFVAHEPPMGGFQVSCRFGQFEPVVAATVQALKAVAQSH